MSSSKSLALLKLSLSPATISLLHTLHTELNTFVSSTSLQPPQTSQSTPKEILEGIFQVIAWDLKAQITHEEFSVLFTEWSKAKGSLLTSSRFFDMIQKNQFPLDQIVLALKNTVGEPRDFHAFLAKALELFSYEYDSFLYRTEDIGFDAEGVRVNVVEQESIALMNEIFKTFDQKEQGHLTVDGLFFLYIALQEKDIKTLVREFDDEEAFCEELNNRFKGFLGRIKCFQGRITALQAKSYFLYNGIASKTELNSLRKSVRNTTEMALELNENVLHEYGGILPDLLQIAVKKAFPSLNLIEINKNPTDLQVIYHFLLVRFYPYVHEQDYFEGLFISNKTLLSQMMVKEARKYYGDEVFRSVNWSFDPTQAFLSVLGIYNELADQILRFCFQFGRDNNKESLFTGRSARPNYFQEGLNLSKDNINTSIQDYSQRHSRSMFSGRSMDNQLSFRDPIEKHEKENTSQYKAKMKGPPSFHLNISKQPAMRVMTRGVSEGMKKEKENNVHYYKATQSSEKKKTVTPKKADVNEAKRKRESSFGKENKKELFHVDTPAKKSSEPAVKKSQSIKKALAEVDTNYSKKLLTKDEPAITQRRNSHQDTESLDKSEQLPPEKSFRKEEEIPTPRLDTSINKGNNQLTQIQEHQQKITQIAASKPPLLKRQNSSKKTLIQNEGPYESFNPRYYEKTTQPTEPESDKIKENTTLDLTRREDKTSATTPDESFAHDKSQSILTDVSRMRAQNQQAWQQEKSILEQLTQRRASHGGVEEKQKNSSFSGSQDLNKINISEIRKASLASQQDMSKDYSKSMRNQDIMDILGKLDTKIYEGKQTGINKPNEMITSASSQGERKMSMQSRNSVVNESNPDEGRSIMDIVKEQLQKDKAPAQTLRTGSDVDSEEPKKEFYLNLKEIISDSKKGKSDSSPGIQKPQDAKVFSMSIADHIRSLQSKKENENNPAKMNVGSPVKEPSKSTKELEVIKDSTEKNKHIQELIGLKKNNLSVKSRQNSSKSPANPRAGRVAKTESFEAVMERLKKGPGSTPTKGKSSKKAF